MAEGEMSNEESERKSNHEELLIDAKNFFNFNKQELGESIRKKSNVIYLDFLMLSEYSTKLSEEVIINPEETLSIFELAVEELGFVKNARVRLRNVPDSHQVKIRNIRSKHLNEMVVLEGIIRQASDVRPQVVNAKFECPSCGTIISVLQMEKKFREPTKCSCGRRGGFSLMSKEMVDTQRLVVEESPESLTGGEQPKRLNVFVKEDLVEPRMEEKTTPGARVKVIGVLKEVPVPLSTGGTSTRFELAIEVNNIIPMEETFEELDINDEDEKEILELSQDPEVFTKLARSIAPSVWGYDEIKKSMVLQLFSGVQKEMSDGSKSRGDIHILLIGDPGVAKSLSGEDRILYSNKDEVGYLSLKEIYKKFGKFPNNLKTLTIDMESHKPIWKPVSEIIRHAPEKDLIKITTEHGKSVTATLDHSFITLNKEGGIVPVKGSELNEKSYVPIPINSHKEILNELEIKKFKTSKTNSKDVPDKIKLDELSGFFFGIFLSEGYIKSGKSISISNKNTKIRGKVEEFAKRLKLESKFNEEEVIINSKSLSNVLKNFCYDENEKEENKTKGNISRIKKIPGFAFFAPREFIRGIISGLFSGDGRFVKNKTMIKGFELVTVSEKLAQGTSDLLFSIGILNKIKFPNYEYRNRKTDYNIVAVPSQSIKKFRKNFNFYGREFLKYFDPVYSYNNIIPCGELVYNVTKKLGYNSRKKGDRNFAAQMRTVKRRGVIGRLRLRKIIKMFEKRTNEKLPELEALKKIAYSPIIWSRIEKIENVKKEEKVYDLSIPKTNTFVSNGIGVHNSVTLSFMANISPKGRYVVGKSTSGAGLTATVVRDEYLKGWSLEAGAMVLANKGLVCIDELEKMDPQDRSAMHEAMEQQCYSRNLELTFSDGSKKKIGDFVDELIERNKEKVEEGINCEILPFEGNEKILTTDFESIHPVKINNVSRHIAPDKFVQIKLSNGREIKVTPEHPCWIVRDGEIKTIPAIDLKKGEFFPIPSELPVEGKEQIFEQEPYFNGPELCKLIGYHVTDGGYELNRGKKNGIQFWNNDQLLIKDYCASVNSVFKINPVITKRKHQFSARVISKKVVEFMQKLEGNLMENGKLKRVPEKIMKCRREDVAFLLRAAFDGDGTVAAVKRGGCRVTLVTENKEFAKQVSELLLRFSILSSVFKDNNVFRVDITGHENLFRFYQHIGFLSDKKRKRLEDYLAEEKKYRSVTDIIPDVSKEIREIFRKLRIKDSEIGNQIEIGSNKHRKFLKKLVSIAETKLGIVLESKNIAKKENNSAILGEIRKKLGLSVLSISKKLGVSNYLLSQYEKRGTESVKYNAVLNKEIDDMVNVSHKLRSIKRLAFGKIRWSKVNEVKVVENRDEKWVYDIMVEPTHSFISNNMVLHNSVTISKANVQACYSEDTEVLTEKGWKKYDEVGKLKIAQYNPKTKKMEFLPHKGLYVYDYKGKMCHFKNKRNDILVTPEHKMLAREFSQKEFSEIKARDLNYNYIKFINSADYVGKEKDYFVLPGIKHKQKRVHEKYVNQHKDKEIPMDLWLEFLGYYVTEGGVETRPTIGIVQKKGKKANKIKKCMKKLSEVLGCSLSEIDCGDYVRFKITQTQLYNFLKDNGEKSHLKKAGINFSELSKRQLNILFDSMMLGDGSSDGKSFSCTSEELVNEFQVVAHLIGKSVSKNVHNKEGNRGRKATYRVTISDRTEPSIRKKFIKKVNYEGKVWCFSTHTGFFVTRRNGKVAIQGNTLKAATSVLAAANPKFGRFDPYQSIAQQIDLPPTLINRFDIIFTLRDIPDKSKDERIASHVLREHQHEQKESIIEPPFFRKYVAYAKQRIHPALSQEASDELRKFYVDLRNRPVSSESGMKPIPISARQLQALIRMAEASAKIRLRENVLKEDALEAIELMKYYLQQVGYDYESKSFDIDKISGKYSSSQRNKIMLVKETITAMESKMGKMIPREELEKELEDRLTKDEIDEIVEKLLRGNEIYRPKRGYIGVF